MWNLDMYSALTIERLREAAREAERQRLNGAQSGGHDAGRREATPWWAVLYALHRHARRGPHEEQVAVGRTVYTM
jgi:hypothetical protein